MDSTKIFSTDEIEMATIKKMIKEVFEILEERGYNPVDQIVGYLISGDPGYISSHKEARSKITKYDRNNILGVLIKEYVQK